MLAFRKVFQAEHILGPAVINLADLVEVDLSSLASASSKDLSLTPIVLLLQHGVRAPDHAHTRTSTSLDTGDRVFKDETLLGSDGSLAGGKTVVDCLQGKKKDVGQRLATTRSQTSVVAEDTTMRRKDGKQLLQVVGLDTEVAKVLLLGSTIFDLPVSGAAEVTEHVDNTGEGLGLGKQLLLKGSVLGDVFLGSDGELSPVVEDLVGLGAGATLKLGLDGPGEGSLAVLLENDVDTLSVDIFGIEEETVHVEEAGPDGREAVIRDRTRSHCGADDDD
ncbi:hypothetical protein HG531_000499 [Fusarium graminearum]|nr:hypothetical protein HG531_000499 [Fusarium graminearum]